MALCTVGFLAESLAKRTKMTVIVPDSGRGPFPVLYLLHGLSDDDSTFARLTSLERYARDLPLIIVMPDGGRSWYVNSEFGAYEDYIVNDVIGRVECTFAARAARGGRAIAGLSMGGYGAMMLGLKHRTLFAAISSHSGALAPAAALKSRPGIQWVVPTLRKRANDCRVLARAARAARVRPAIRFDCGVDDGLLQPNRAFHAYLGKIGLDHTYEEFAGGHTWEYWDTHIRDTLKFILRHVSPRS